MVISVRQLSAVDHICFFFFFFLHPKHDTLKGKSNPTVCEVFDKSSQFWHVNNSDLRIALEKENMLDNYMSLFCAFTFLKGIFKQHRPKSINAFPRWLTKGNTLENPGRIHTYRSRILSCPLFVYLRCWAKRRVRQTSALPPGNRFSGRMS